MEFGNKPFTGVIFAKESRDRLYSGLKKAAEAVTATMGPRGKTVLIQKEDALPIVTKDGVTVSKSIRLKDPVERMGAQLICEAAARTNDVAGDGTTTATLLTYAMVTEGLKLVNAGQSAIDVKNAIEDGVKKLLSSLRAISKPIKIEDRAELVQIATISANGDKAIGELIADAIQKVGRDGIVTVEDAKGLNTTLDIVDGMQLERGYLSPYFVTNNEKMNVTFQDCLVLIVNGKLNSFRDMVSALEAIQKLQCPLLVMADEFDGDALNGLVLNKMHANLPVVAIKNPGFGISKDQALQDIAVLSGGKIVSAQTGLTIDKVKPADLGKLAKVTVDRNSTVLVGRSTTRDGVDAHINTLRAQLSDDVTLSDEEQVTLRQRIAKLSSGVAVIRVGGSTEIEMVERKYRIEDALNATKAAVEEGIVPGGGGALLRARAITRLPKDGPAQHVLNHVCTAPIRKIVENCGKSADVVLDRYWKAAFPLHLMGSFDEQLPSLGYDVATEDLADMYEKGVIDPLKVTRSALENAVSVAATFLSLDAVVFDDNT